MPFAIGILILVSLALAAVTMGLLWRWFVRKAQHDLRTLEHILERKRIPRSWLGKYADCAERNRDAAYQRANKRLDHYMQLAKRTPAFGNGETRALVVGAIQHLQQRMIQEPFEDLLGPDPRLRRHVVFFDCGDTLVDEGTEVRNDRGIVVEAALIPGARRTVRWLAREGFTLALVADGERESFKRVLRRHRMWQYFEATAISGDLGVTKPAPGMFRYALDQLEIPPENYQSVVMVGNNLARDIKGANRLGLVSVWLDWAPRRSKLAADDEEQPDFTIHKPEEVVKVVEQLESGAGSKRGSAN